jgi:hypothetical protein
MFLPFAEIFPELGFILVAIVNGLMPAGMSL